MFFCITFPSIYISWIDCINNWFAVILMKDRIRNIPIMSANLICSENVFLIFFPNQIDLSKLK